MKRFIKLLNEDRIGASTFEFTIQSPWFFMMVFLVFAFMLVCFSWASFSSLASNIANDLNIRQTGITRANDIVTAAGSQDAALAVEVMKGNHRETLNADQIIMNTVQGGEIIPKENDIKNAVIVAANKNKYQFLFPFTTFDSVNVSVKRPDGSIPTYADASFLASKNFVSSIIQVDVHYNFLPVKAFGFGWDGIPMSCSAEVVCT